MRLKKKNSFLKMKVYVSLSHFTTRRIRPRTRAINLRVSCMSVLVLAGPVEAIWKPKKRGKRMRTESVGTAKDLATNQKKAQEAGATHER